MRATKRIMLTLGLTAASSLALICTPILLVDIEGYEYQQPTTEQFTWQEAVQGCNSLDGDWQLPGVYQLLALYYRQDRVPLVTNTDYWSRNSYFGFAFGLNTHSGIASFDRHADTDHYLCVRSKKGSD